MEFDENDPIRYDHWIEDALRSVIRQALSYTAENGLVGDHHFYITFRTDNGVIELPDYLRAQHPQEMTIVLQHQYEHLSVEDDRFFVSLRFNGQVVNLNIPFEEITGFTDPSVNFGLQLKTTELDEDDLEEYDYPFEPPAEEQDKASTSPTRKPVKLAAVSDTDTYESISTDDSPPKDGAAGDDSETDNVPGPKANADDSSENSEKAGAEDDSQKGEVIALDAFRKK